MKHKKATKKDWRKVPWTRFERVPVPTNELYLVGDNEPPAMMYVNSRYQVGVWFDGDDIYPTFGRWAHLSIKTHDRAAFHDWRDFQRIKNDIIGPEFDAIEIYPCESKLVDTCNQYHLFVFKDLRLPMGFQSRLVSEGSTRGAEQRPFDERPSDCRTSAELDAMLDAAIADKRRRDAAAEGQVAP